MPTTLGPAEILVIVVFALVVLGPNRLPSAARQVGRAMSELRRWSSGVQDELRTALDPEPVSAPPPVPPPPASTPPAPPPPVPPPPAPTPPAPAPPVPASEVPANEDPASDDLDIEPAGEQRAESSPPLPAAEASGSSTTSDR